MQINISELSARESASVEWKENVADIRDVIATITAFANDYLNYGGGYVICGAKEEKDSNGFPTVKYVGLTAQRLKEVKERVINDCTHSLRVNPIINPIVEEIEVPNDPSRRILVFVIDATPYAHTYKSDKDDIPRYYVRTEYNTKEATNGMIRELLRRKGQIEPWDRRINTKATIDDIDQLALREYLQVMNLWSPNKSIERYLSDKEKIEEFIPTLLGRIGIDKPSYPKNFTILVFGKRPKDFFDSAYSIFATFKSIDRSDPIGEAQWITGSIVEQAKKIIELLNIEASIAVDKNSQKPNQVKYPTIALKEAVVNALVHRDYEIDQPVRIEIYTNRIEIYSPGGLPFNVDKEKFIKGQATASWRNQSLARIFQFLQLAQHLGSGISRIIKSMKEEGCPDPIFDVQPDSLTCILPAHPRHQILKQLSEAESEIVIKDYVSAFKKLDIILQKDPLNYRAIELFCDVNLFLGTPEKVFDFMQKSKIDINLIRPNTLISLSEVLSQIKNNPEVVNLSELLLEKALNSKLEEKELLKIAYTYRKLGENKKVITFIDNILSTYPNMQSNAALLQQRGRAYIDLAKICQETATNPKTKQQFKERAYEDLKNYLMLAENDLAMSLQFAESTMDRDWIKRDLQYLDEDMKPLLSKSGKKGRRILHVTNISRNVTKADLDNIFGEFGKIERVKLPDNFRGGHKGHADIYFETPEDAQRAYDSKDDIIIKGNKVSVFWFKPHRPK